MASSKGTLKTDQPRLAFPFCLRGRVTLGKSLYLSEPPLPCLIRGTLLQGLVKRKACKYI